jgi:hypothetical protein
MVKIGDYVQMWIGVSTVEFRVLGFSPSGQIILCNYYHGINHKTGRMDMIEEVYYRDYDFIEYLNR